MCFLCLNLSVKAQQGYFYGSKFIELRANQTKQVSFVRQKAKKNGNIYTSKIYNTDNIDSITILPKIIVCLKNSKAISDVISLYKGVLYVSDQHRNTFYLDCNVNTSDEVLEIVNKLSSVDNILWCEPDMCSGNTTNAPNSNPLYDWQYYLKGKNNNGTFKMGINVEHAWEIVTVDPNITIGVIDTGVDLNHEDLAGSILEGYTVDNPIGYGEPQNWTNDDKGHGTCCAGIIGACDNNIGIKGVASGVRLLPVNIVPYFNIGTTHGFAPNSEKAKAIRWAYPKSDILSCSWGCIESNDIRNAIMEAQKEGRAGKGTIIVAASGNTLYSEIGGPVSFPANVDGVIAVGAVDENGKITNYSNRGKELSVVAPGQNITTIDYTGGKGYNPTNYMTNFSGTSAACPQVAGVVALMLSANPDLSAERTKTILESTTLDLGDNGFDETYGYGLVNAAKAVACSYMDNMAIIGPSVVKDTAVYSVENLPSGYGVSWSQSNASSLESSSARIEYDMPNEGMVTIYNTTGFSIVLKAEVQFVDGISYELKQKISGISPTLWGVFYEVSSIDGRKSSEIPLVDDIDGDINMATPPNDIVVISDCFVNKKITYRYSDSNWAEADRNLQFSEDRFTLEMPELENGRTLDFTVWEKEKVLYTFKFGALKESPHEENLSLIAIGKDIYKIKLNADQTESSTPQISEEKIHIEAINGQNIQKAKQINVQNNNLVDLSNLPKGMYLIKIIIDQSIYYKKIFKN